MNKPTKDEILQALDDLDEGNPISADMRVAVNQYQRLRVENHLAQEANTKAVRELAAQIKVNAIFEEWARLDAKKIAIGLTPQEDDRYQRLWMFEQVTATGMKRKAVEDVRARIDGPLHSPRNTIRGGAEDCVNASKVQKTDILSLLLVGSKNERETFVKQYTLTSWQHGQYRPIMKLCQDVFGEAIINQLALGFKNDNPDVTFNASNPAKSFMVVILRALAPNMCRGDEAKARVALVLQSILELEATLESEKAARAQAFDRQMADGALVNMQVQRTLG